MARIQARKGKKRTTYTLTIRMKGFPCLSRTFDTKGEAKSWAADIEKEMRAGRYQDASPLKKFTFSDAMEQYLEQVSSQKRPNSERRDKDAVKAILRKIDGSLSLADITSQRLASYLDARVKEVSPSTIQKEFALLSHLFNVARKEWGLSINNPAADVSRPKIRNGRTRFLTNDEAQRLLDAAQQSRNKKLYHYLLLMMHTGMRPSEAAGLKWCDVDLDARIVKLLDTKIDMRYVPLSEIAAANLLSIRPDDVQVDTPVFLPGSTSSKRLQEVPALHFKKAFENARGKAKLEDVHLHDLRHTAASHLLMAGVDLRTIAEILGHKTMQMVHRYTHLLNEHKLKAVERINSLGLE